MAEPTIMEISDDSSVETRPAKKQKTKQIAPAKKWCMTWNNYPENWRALLEEHMDKYENYIFGEEVGESGTHHIQGLIHFKQKLRVLSLGLPKEIHWEKQRASKDFDASQYCAKDGKVWCSLAWTPQRQPHVYTFEQLLPHQRECVELARTVPDDRTIHWWCENTGNIGKSALVRHLVKNFRCAMSAGKASDMKFIIVAYHAETGFWPDVVIFDVPRSCLNYLSYTGMEEIKNGCFASSKYEGCTVLMPHPHVFVFANEEPNYEAMSSDRWVVHDLSGVPQILDSSK